MIISKKKHMEMVEHEIEEERERLEMEHRLADLGRNLYNEVGRLETLIRSIEARVMAHMEEKKDEKA